VRSSVVAPSLRILAVRPLAGGGFVADLRIEGVPPDRDALLRQCIGFLVDSVDAEVGVVDDVVATPDGGRVAALVVACGWGGRRLLEVPADAVSAVLPEERRIVIRTEPQSRAPDGGKDGRPAAAAAGRPAARRVTERRGRGSSRRARPGSSRSPSRPEADRIPPVR
jgi:hypothetical protein